MRTQPPRKRISLLHSARLPNAFQQLHNYKDQMEFPLFTIRRLLEDTDDSEGPPATSIGIRTETQNPRPAYLFVVVFFCTLVIFLDVACYCHYRRRRYRTKGPRRGYRWPASGSEVMPLRPLQGRDRQSEETLRYS